MSLDLYFYTTVLKDSVFGQLDLQLSKENFGRL